MDKYAIRRELLGELIDERFDGVIARFADQTGVSASYVSRLLYDPEKAGAKRLGEELAEKIEQALGLPHYFSPDQSAPDVRTVREPSTVYGTATGVADMTIDEMELVRHYRGASRVGRSALLALATELSKVERNAEDGK